MSTLSNQKHVSAFSGGEGFAEHHLSRLWSNFAYLYIYIPNVAALDETIIPSCCKTLSSHVI